MSHEFDSARQAYRPKTVKVLMIAESPPSSGGFFYFPETIGKDHLFRETMKATGLWPGDEPLRKGVDKREMLSRFRSMGFYLLDASTFPVDKMSAKERRATIQSQIPRLVQDVIHADPDHIVIVKSSIFWPVRIALRGAGLESKILNHV